MVTKMAEKAETGAAEKAGYQEELLVKAPGVEIPEAVQHKAQRFIDNYVAFLEERTEAYMERMSQPRPEAATPALASGYQYWNVLTVGPLQFLGNPPYRPSKIIAGGELALMLGIVWINPVNSDGGGLPGTVVLGDRDYRVRFETINLSTVSDGPDSPLVPPFIGTFPSLAPIVTAYPWFFVPPDPGPNPQLFETTLTADVTTIAQPFAAFSTWHFDVDSEPPFLGRPMVSPEWQHDIPARFLVYRK